VFVAGEVNGWPEGALSDRLAADAQGRIGWGWSPAHDRVVPVAEIDAAAPGLIARDRALLRRSRRDALLQTLAFGALGLAAATIDPSGLIILAIALVSIDRWFANTQALRRLERDADDYRRGVADTARFGWWLSRQHTPAAQALVASIALAAVAQAVDGGMGHRFDVAAGAAALIPERIWAGEWWRLLSHGLMHASLAHMLINLLSMYALARLSEALAGRAAVILAFVIAVAAGGAASLIAPPHGISVGSSGGVFGLVGFLLVAVRRQAPPGLGAALTRGIALMAVVSLVFWNVIDHAAHAGGLVAGLLVGALVPTTAVERRGWEIAGWIAAAAWAMVTAHTLGLLLQP